MLFRVNVKGYCIVLNFNYTHQVATVTIKFQLKDIKGTVGNVSAT